MLLNNISTILSNKFYRPPFNSTGLTTRCVNEDAVHPDDFPAPDPDPAPAPDPDPTPSGDPSGDSQTP
jgi:hypothetical protein